MDKKAAKEIASILGEVLETQLATKENIKTLEFQMKIEQTKGELLNWMIGLLIGQTGILVAAIKLL